MIVSLSCRDAWSLMIILVTVSLPPIMPIVSSGIILECCCRSFMQLVLIKPNNSGIKIPVFIVAIYNSIWR